MAWYNFHYQKGGGGVTINRIFKEYFVKYIGSFKSEIRYNTPKNFDIKYVEDRKNLKIQYLGSEQSAIKYLSPRNIKLKYNDNNS
jgi:hypothetical protein